MKQMPYTVPEGFFEKAGLDAVASAGKIASRRRTVAGVFCGAAIAFGLFFGIFRNQSEPVDTYACNSDEEILELYEYDIFLNNY